jgi:hypothetical protein
MPSDAFSASLWPAIRLMQMRPPESWSKAAIIFASSTGLM